MRKNKWVISYLPPLAFGFILLLVPLLRDVHLESALLVATLSCFWGGWKSARLKRNSDLKLIQQGIASLLLIFIPLFVHGLINHCITADGILLWALLPLPALMFGIAIGRFYRMISIPATAFVTILTLLVLALGIWIFEFFRLPQVYYFNHVWGYWPGPIYDEEIRVTASLFWFRASTILWVMILWALPTFSKSISSKLVTITSAIAVLVILFFQPTLGISTPPSELQNRLEQQYETPHFTLYYDEAFYSPQEIDYWAKRHEFHFNQIVEQLEIDWPDNRKIDSYLYNHAWHKKELVGAKFTSYVPVWLQQDQLHIAKEHLEGVLKHELVHVLSKQFGNSLFNASWSIGLVEGVAEAIAGDASDVSTLDQIIAAEQPLPTTAQMRSALSVTGFYGSASAISYTTTGSFVKYLLRNYPVEQFKAAYPNADFEYAFDLPFDTLVHRWKAQLPVGKVDSLDVEVSQYVFSQQSIFQMSCPRKTHPILKGLDDFRFYEANNEPEKAFEVIEALYLSYPRIIPVKQLWARENLTAGKTELLIEAISLSDSLPSFHLYKADALYAANGFTVAQNYLNDIKDVYFDKEDHMLNQSLDVRADSLSWRYFFNARYNNETTSTALFESMQVPLQWLLMDRAIQNWELDRVASYSNVLIEKDTNPTWFDTQERIAYSLVYYDEAELATRWIERMKSFNLRDRYQERISELEQWTAFNLGN